MNDGNSCLQPGIDAKHQQLASRAPHGHGVWRNESIALGVLGPSPYSDHHSGLTIASTARLDDRRNLIRKLGIDSGLSDQLSDSAFILSAYGKWGRECADHLLGDFAFAIWDPREKQLFCARDHIGARPFYYHVSRDLFVFGSSARAVASYPMVPADINRARVADLLADCLESVNETSSFFKSVRRFLPLYSLAYPRDHGHLDAVRLAIENCSEDSIAN
jgi:asparagine synthase (glutamine-hydrolysing)